MLNLDDSCVLLSYYTACSGNSLPQFRDNLQGPSSRVESKMGLVGFPEMSVRNNHYMLCNSPEEHSSH